MSRRRAPRTLGEFAARRLRREAEEMHWQDVIDEAASLQGLEYTPEGWEALAAWYATLPKGLPSRYEQERWLRQQRVLASWRASEGVA
jgi:hypothetical protein